MTHRPPIRALFVLAALPLWAAGCQQPGEPLRPPLPPPVKGSAPLGPRSRTDANEATRKLLVVRLRLVTVQLPIGSVSDSEELWNYLDEEPVGARIGSGLAYNGFRAGLGQDSAWPDIAKILRQLTGQPLTRSHMLAQIGQPLAIVLKPGQDAQTIFTFRPDRTLYGQDYPPGDNVLTLTAGVDLDKPSDVHLMCAPLIRSTRRRPRYVKEPGGYLLSAEATYYPLEELEFQFKVPAGGFILIGPGRGLKRPSSPGYHFLVREKNGAKFETILVIAPEVFYAPVRESE